MKKLNQAGIAHILLILLSAIGFLFFLLISNTFNFRGRLFSNLFLKPASRAQVTQPNIVVIMTDDQDTASISVMTKVKTLLADKGITFTNSFVDNSLCCPSRATFLTGQASHNNGVFTNGAPDGGYGNLEPTLGNSLPVWLQIAGYNTAHIGKMPNGFTSTSAVPPGWNTFKGLTDPETYRYSNYQLNENGVLNIYNNCPDPATNCPDYQTDVLAQKAVAYINSRASNPQPFFLTVTPLAPHVEFPAQPPAFPRPAPRHLGTFVNVPLPTPPSFNEADVSDKPSFIRSDAVMDAAAISYTQTSFQKRRETLLAVDDMVESIVNALQGSGKLNDTVIIFTSDNGFFHGEHRQYQGKLLLYEESIRVPFIISGKGVMQGQTRNQIVNNVDIPATIIELANATPGRTLDGRSLVPLFQNPAAPWRSALLVQGTDDPLPDEIARYKAVRTSRFIYAEHTLLAGGVEKELYDLTVDPYELESKHADPAYASIMSGLQSMLTTLATCVGASCWMTTPEPTPSPKPGDINGDGSVNIVDFSIMLSKWNTSDPGADLNKDGAVNVVDFSILLSNWGT